MKEHNSDSKRFIKYYDYVFLAILVLVASAVVILRLKIQTVRGPGYDTYAFLANALTMAGKSNYFEIYRPPVLPFLTSIVFRFGLDSELAIFLIDGLFFILGVAGLYLLARLRLSPLSSLAAGLIFISFPDMIENVTFGITDVLAISLSIWILYFTVLAVERNPRYYLVVPPLFMITFLTRFTAAVMVFPVLFYLLLRGNTLRNIRFVTQGVSLAFLVIFADLAYYYAKAKGDLLIQFSAPYAVAATVTPEASITGGPTPSRFYFIKNLPKFLSPSILGYVMLALFAAGLMFFLMRLLMLHKNKRQALATFSLLALLGVSVYLVFSGLNFVLANALLLGIFLLVAYAFFDIDKRQAFLLLMFFWFLTFLTYHSHQAVKVSRYFITIAPAVAFFMAFGFESALDIVGRLNLRRSLYILVIIPLVVVLVVLPGLAANASYQKIRNMPGWSVPGLKEANEWVREHSKKSDIVYSDYFVASAWYTRRPIRAMPTFEDRRAFNHELEKYRADYFISVWHHDDFPSYHIVKNIGDVSIYKRKSQPLPKKPTVFLIGKDIDHYIEDILNFKFYVIRDRTPFPDDLNRSVGTTYLDDYNLERLKKYQVLLLYNFRWHDIGKAEKLLIDYLAGGGTLIIDASGNSGKSFYDLNNVDFLGVSVLKQPLPASPKITITSDLNLKGGVDEKNFARFVDENGEPWFGSAYEKTPLSKEETKKLVTADGKTLIGLQQRGRGRIIWIGHNLIFHAFYNKNKAEKKLIQNVFRLAAK